MYSWGSTVRYADLGAGLHNQHFPDAAKIFKDLVHSPLSSMTWHKTILVNHVLQRMATIVQCDLLSWVMLLLGNQLHSPAAAVCALRNQSCSFDCFDIPAVSTRRLSAEMSIFFTESHNLHVLGIV